MYRKYDVLLDDGVWKVIAKDQDDDQWFVLVPDAGSKSTAHGIVRLHNQVVNGLEP